MGSKYTLLTFVLAAFVFLGLVPRSRLVNVAEREGMGVVSRERVMCTGGGGGGRILIACLCICIALTCNSWPGGQS